MKTYILAAALAVFSAGAFAAPWVLENLGRHIQETNFVLDGRCSATLIDHDRGILLTAHHCVARKEIGDRTTVKQQIYDDHEVIGIFLAQAEYVAADPKNDLALLQLTDGTSAPYTMEATLATEAPNVGETLWVVGNPLMLDNTVTRGILSAKHRTTEKHEYWQTDANIIGGASGGAVYNDAGELIGVVSAGMSAIVGLRPIPLGINFIIPLDRVRALVEDYTAPAETAEADG